MKKTIKAKVGKKRSVKAPKAAKAPAKVLPYKNPKLPIEKRVIDLLGRMTLEEKAAQMMCVWQQKDTKLLDASGKVDEKLAKKNFKDIGIGQVGRISDTMGGLLGRANAELANSIQKFFVENTRLGIPVVIHEECLHGQMAMGATSFCQPIGLAATWDTELVEKLFTMVALEARSRGTHQALTPVVDVAREPRWGRVEETYGEDPYLVSRMGVAAVKGFQGDGSFKNKNRIMATLKHFAAHGQPESGMNCAPANVSERVLRETFLSTFKACIQEAGCVSVMPSYNEIDGLPSHANKWLLRDVLRKEWNWNGFTVSDYYAIEELNDRPMTHGQFLAADKKEACILAVKAGVNIELPEPDCYLHLVELVKAKKLKEAELDDLVGPMLYYKFKMGLFEDPYVDPAIAEKVVGCDEHRPLALQAAKEAITLLKNEGNLVPLNMNQVKTLAVIGPNADRCLHGGYSALYPINVSILDGIKAKVGDKVNVVYCEGCKIMQPGTWAQDELFKSDPEEDAKGIAAAVEVAKEADVVVLCIGGNELTSREAWKRDIHMGDRANLDLFGMQQELVDAILATGKPVIVILNHGRPNSINKIAQTVPAIFECWYLGQEMGHAVAEVLFGDFNPGGKLPISIPRSSGHLPVFYNYKPAARRGYLFEDVSPLFAFGYGLSYSTFSFGKPKLKKAKIGRKDKTQVAVEVTNTGKVKGDEVVQMYIRDRFSSVTRPVKELKGFKRVTLNPGETKKVALEIEPKHLAFYNVEMEYVVESGEFEIMVGNSSRDCDLQKVVLTVL